MPDTTSGQPMDTYAGDCGYCGSMGGNASPAAAQDAVPLVGEKEAHGPGRYGVGDWASQIMDTGKHKGIPVPFTRGSDSMMDVGGPH